MFINSFSDWHIGSSTIHVVGAGLNLYSTTPADVDFDGNPRPPSPTAWDIGAYSYKPLP